MLSLVKVIWSKVKDSKVFWALIVGIVLFGGGYYSGSQKVIPVEYKEKLVEDVVSKQKLKEQLELNISLQQQLETASKTITELKSHVRIVERIVTKPDGTTTVDRTTDTDTTVKTDSDTNTSVVTNSNINVKETKDSELEVKTHKEIEKISKPILKPWFVGPVVTWVPTAPVDRQFYGGIAFGRYLGTIPLLNVPVSASIGLSVPVYKPLDIPAVSGAFTVGF